MTAWTPLVFVTPFDHWSARDFQRDGDAIAELFSSEALEFRSELAMYCRAAQRQSLPVPRLALIRRRLAREALKAAAFEAGKRRQREHDQYMRLPAYMRLRGRLVNDVSNADALEIINSHRGLVMLGTAGAGKTTVAREWEFFLSDAITTDRRDIDLRLPIIIAAAVLPAGRLTALLSPAQMIEVLRDGATATVARRSAGRRTAPTLTSDQAELLALLSRPIGELMDLATLGAFHLTFDGLNELEAAERPMVSDFILTLRTLFPEMPVLVTHRSFNFDDSLLRPFPVMELQNVAQDEVETYIARVFAHERQHRQGEALIAALFGSSASREVRELAHTPLFVWMLTTLVLEHSEKKPTDILSGRGGLFQMFSTWYLEQRSRAERGEPPFPYQYSIEAKVAFLSRLGAHFVRNNEFSATWSKIDEVTTDLADLDRRQLLDEIVDSNLLDATGGRYSFIHQSFAEYFAALHFQQNEARDDEALTRRIAEYGWHDTLVILMGFGDIDRQLVEKIIRMSVRVGVVLAARLMRATEYDVEEWTALFISEIKRQLLDPNAGALAWQHAAEALRVLARELAIAALFSVAGDDAAPLEGRAAVVEQIASAVAANELDGEARLRLLRLVRKMARSSDDDVVVLAISASTTGGLGEDFADLIDSPSPKVRDALWRSMPQSEEVGLDRRKILARLVEIETNLPEQAEGTRIASLNDQRLELLRRLADRQHICEALERRFSLRIDQRIGTLLREILRQESGPTASAELELILAPAVDGIEQRCREWALMVQEAEICEACAAGHRLVDEGASIPLPVAESLLHARLDPLRRRIAVAVAAASGHARELAPLLDKQLRADMHRVSDSTAAEAWAQGCRSLKSLDSQAGTRLWAVAAYIFYDHRQDAARPGYFPLVLLDGELACSSEDYRVMLGSDEEDDRRAAVYDLSFRGLGDLLKGQRCRHTSLSETAAALLKQMAEAETDPTWQGRIACAAADAGAVDLLPWLLSLAQNSRRLRSETRDIYDLTHGKCPESLLAVILRAIGSLTRDLVDRGDEERAAEARQYLENEVSKRALLGRATALAYLGQWMPVLLQLGDDYHRYNEDVADSLFRYWIPHNKEGDREREAAASWTYRRMNSAALAPKGRDALYRLHDRLCRELGRFIN